MFGLLYSFRYLSDFFVSYSWKLHQVYLDIFFFEFVDVRYGFYDSIIYEDIDHTFSDTLDIHTIFADEVLDLLFHFLRTLWIRTVIMNIYIRHWFITRRTIFRRMYFFFFASSPVSDNTYDVWNHFSASLQSNPIMEMDIFFFDEIPIVQ